MRFVIISFVPMALLLHQSNGQVTPDCYNDWDNGESYRGRVSNTTSGLECQNWDMQSPHEHTRTPENYPFAGLEKNYCRNPDLDDRPWCYTTKRTERWEYCDIPVCSDQSTAVEKTVRPTTNSMAVKIETTSITNSETMATTRQSSTTIAVDLSDCYNVADDGASYRGVIATTENGHLCQKWIEQSPHQHSRTPVNFPNAGLENNYCRNPDNEERPWCYTTNRKQRWEYCNVQKCPDISSTIILTTTAITDLSASSTTERSTSTTLRPSPETETSTTTKGSASSNSDFPADTAKVTLPSSITTVAVEVAPTEPIQTIESTTASIHSTIIRTTTAITDSSVSSTTEKSTSTTLRRSPVTETSSTTKGSAPSNREFPPNTAEAIPPPPVTTAAVEVAPTEQIQIIESTTAKKRPCDVKPCHVNATCQDNGDSHSCRCKVGLRGDGVSLCRLPIPCEDTPCHAKAFCLPAGNDFRCRCRPGYEGDGISCQIVNHCRTGSCHRDAICRHTADGSLTCTCRAGFQGNGLRCRKISPCETLQPCHENATCQDNGHSYSCRCKDGMTGNGVDMCRPLRPCENKRCHAKADCAPFAEQFHCICRRGYDGDGTTCQSMDHCKSQPCDRHATCHNTKGSVVCTCRDGFHGDGFRCRKIDPCERNPCQINARCIPDEDSHRGYKCECIYGKERHQDGSISCIGPCSKALSDRCSKNAKCVMYGNAVKIFYKCTCNKGYYGDGKRCREVPPCDSVKCPRNTKCVNENKSHFHCQCTSGYTGIGPSCSVASKKRCDVVSTSWDKPRQRTPRYCKWNPCHYRSCQQHSTCKETLLGAFCECDNGFTRRDGRCVEVRPCDSVKCPKRTKCVNENESHFHCQCTSGYTGIGPSCSVSSKKKCEDGFTVWGVRRTPDYCNWNPCHYSSCRQHSTCKNAWFGHFCECNNGFTLCDDKCVDDRRLSIFDRPRCWLS